MTGDPLFPGESDIDQLYLIVKMLGKPCHRHQHLMSRSSNLRGMIKSASNETNLYKHFPNWPLYALEFLSNCMKMDPHERSTSEELLKNNFFTHDRFPQKFLPVLRERVNIEFNDNPLLRKYKTEILMSTDKKDEYKSKKFQQNDQARWKFTLAEGSVKRKYACDIFSNSENEKNLISLAKTSQRLNIVQQKSSQNITTTKPGNAQNNSSKEKVNVSSEMQMLEKSLESLSKLNNKNYILRPKTAQKQDIIENLALPPSPLQFQSLQQQTYGDYNKSPNVLHPSINNISFNRDPPKRSPNLLQSLNIKSNLSQAPLLSNPRTQFLKKFDRDINGDNANNLENTSWLAHSKKNPKTKNDVFTLPNLPGGNISKIDKNLSLILLFLATSSPNKNKKKILDTDLLQSNMTVTPVSIDNSKDI